MDVSYYKRFNELIDKYIEHEMSLEEQVEYEQLCQLILTEHFIDQPECESVDQLQPFNRFQ